MVDSSLRSVSSIAAAVALASCLAVFVLSRLFPSSLYGGRAAHFELRLLLWWTLAELCAAGSNLVFNATQDEGGDETPHGHTTGEASVLCVLQGGIMHAAYLATFLWTVSAHSVRRGRSDSHTQADFVVLLLCVVLFIQLFIVLHRWLLTVRGSRHGSKWEGLYALLAFGLPLGDAFLVWRLGYLGPTDLWCWIDSEKHADAQWLHFHLPLIFIAVALLSLHLSTVFHMRAHAAQGQFGCGSELARAPLPSARRPRRDSSSSVPIMSGGVHSDGETVVAAAAGPTVSHWSPLMRHTTILLMFLCLRIPALLHRGWEWVRPRSRDYDETPENFTLEVLHALASPLQGVLPLLVFLHTPRMNHALLQRWNALVGNHPVTVADEHSAASIRGSTNRNSSGSVTVSSPPLVGDYRSLADRDNNATQHSLLHGSSSSSDRAHNVEAVFPAVVWNSLQNEHAVGARASAAGSSSSPRPPLVPPTAFRAFPLSQAQQPLPLCSAGGTAPGVVAASAPPSYRVFAGSWNMGNTPAPMDPSHPSFSSASARKGVLPTAASGSLAAFLPSGASAGQFDLIVVGVQECAYDPVRGRSTLARALLGWYDARAGIPSNEHHWVETVLSVVNFGRTATSAPAAVHTSAGGVVLGPDMRPFGLVGHVSMGHIRLLALVHPRLLSSVADVRTCTEAAGLGNMYMNKGGVGLSLSLLSSPDADNSSSTTTTTSTSFAFVNVHLAALDGFLLDRNEDVVQILSRLALRGSVASASTRNGQDDDDEGLDRPPVKHDVIAAAEAGSNLTALDEQLQRQQHQLSKRCPCTADMDSSQSFDFAVFLGDLNYRLAVPLSAEAHAQGLGLNATGKNKSKLRGKALAKARQRDQAASVARALEAGNLEFLWAADELASLQREHKLFVGWKEPIVTFMPTYKYRDISGPLMPRTRSIGGHEAHEDDEEQKLAVDHAVVVASSVASNGAVLPGPIPSPTSAGMRSYDPSLYAVKRTPAYCDRILYRCDEESCGVQVLEYRDVLSVDSSDHKPVRAVFAIDFSRANKNKQQQQQQQRGNASTAASGSRARSPPRVAEDPEDEERKHSASPPPRAALSPPRRRKRTDSDNANNRGQHDAASSSSPPPAAVAAISSGAAAGALATPSDFLAAHPSAAELISPASLRLLSAPLLLTASSAAASSRCAPTRFRISLTELTLFDALDLYGLPLVAPFISFVSPVLCHHPNTDHEDAATSARANGAPSTRNLLSRGGGAVSCVRFHTTVAVPLAGSGDALQSVAREALASSMDNFSPFQSSPTALRAHCVRVCEWDPRPLESLLAIGDHGGAAAGGGGDEESPDRLASGDWPTQPHDIPVLVTPRRWSVAALQRQGLQLVLKDAQYQGTEAETLGTAVLPLGAGMMLGDAALTAQRAQAHSPSSASTVRGGGAAAAASNNSASPTPSHPAPVFFMVPLLAQTRYMGFLTGYLRVTPVAADA